MPSRVFLLGNGRSLRETNLELLRGQQVIGVNKIEQANLPFKLSYYVKVDYSAFDADDWKAEILPHVNRGTQCLLWDAFRAGADKNDGNYEFIHDGIGDFSNVRYIPRCKHHYQLKGEWHHICTGLNSILTMAIWAVELGFEEIVLVGCDGKFTNPKEDHFTEDYYKTWDFMYEQRNNECVQKAHDILKEKCPIPILDATVNGHLTQHKKVGLKHVTTRVL